MILPKNIIYQDYNLFYKGDINLLYTPKVAIVGTRKPSKYTKEMTAILSAKLSKKYTIVSGGAYGVDAVAHRNAKKTIMVSPAGIDTIYPKINKNLIENIIENHLIISEYEGNYMPRAYNFIYRNRIVVNISDFIIITEADRNSGSMRSFEWAKKFNKKVFVLPHRIGESEGTNYLVKTGEAEVIWDIEEFIFSLGIEEKSEKEKKIMNFNDAFLIYGDKLYEMELDGEIKIENGKVYF
jgi:DNA processing protein